VKEVLAPALIVPGHFVGKGKNKRSACLCDFETSFRIVLPLTMMRDHVASKHVQTYEPRMNLVPTNCCITPPAPTKQRTGDSRIVANTNPNSAAAIHDQCLDAVCDIHDDSDSDDDNAFDSELFYVTEDGDNNDPFCEDAEKEICQEHFETIWAAEAVAEMVQKEGKVDLLYCDDLDAPPNLIKQVFSLMKAVLLWDEKQLNEIIEKLKENDWTDNIQSALYFWPGFFCNRIECIALPPRELYWWVCAVFVTFGSKIDSNTGKPLFNKAAWMKANNLLKEILLGYYSDPPGFNFN
jgi:hypothetical protein